MNNQNKNIDLTKLYEAIRNGDELAFSHYYESTMPWLVPLIHRITNDTEEAWNIAQDTFAKLWLHREQINASKSLDGFMSKIANNAAVDFLRKQRSRYKYLGEQMFAQNAEDFAADSSLLASEMELHVKRAIGKMPPQRRMVFKLSREHNLTYNEIAEQTNLSVETVKMHIKLALKEIRDAISLFLLLLLIIILFPVR